MPFHELLSVTNEGLSSNLTLNLELAGILSILLVCLYVHIQVSTYVVLQPR